VPGERDERRSLGDVADDPDPFEAEPVGDRLARALQNRARAELTAGQRSRERVESF
jgi:hypothetical protein